MERVRHRPSPAPAAASSARLLLLRQRHGDRGAGGCAGSRRRECTVLHRVPPFPRSLFGSSVVESSPWRRQLRTCTSATLTVKGSLSCGGIEIVYFSGFGPVTTTSATQWVETVAVKAPFCLVPEPTVNS